MKTFLTFLEQRRPVAVFISLLALLIASLALALDAEGHHDALVRQSAEVQARILADSVSAALSFSDMAAINQYTSALRANPDVVAVAVYDANGKLVAHYGSEAVPNSAILAEKVSPTPPAMAVTAPVTESGVRLGTVYVSQIGDNLITRISRYAPAGLLVVMALLMLSIMAFDARALAAGNQRLRQEMNERQRAEAALRQSQKMEAVGRLTGGIAHDFNNMLAVIIGNLDILLRRYPEADPKMLRFVSGSQEAAKRAAALTHRLLAFSRLQPLDPKSADIGKSVTDMSDLLRRTLGETISIETVRAAGLWRAHVDIGQLETALVNLAVNARDAMPGGGKLTIETSNAYLDRTYANAQEEVVPGQYVVVAVTDTGTGMTPEVLDKVFEPFFTTKPVGLGTGLGLSQVHGFVKQSGGHVTIYSEVGHGTTIRLYLPRSQADAEANIAEPPKRAAHDRRDVTVLVVDDEKGVREFASEALVELGYDVLSADSLDQAMQVAGNSGPINILLTDVVMPGGSGRQLADAIVRIKPEIRVIYMTGYTQNAIVHNGTLDAGTHLISKPFTIGQLGDELDALSSN